MAAASANALMPAPAKDNELAPVPVRGQVILYEGSMAAPKARYHYNRETDTYHELIPVDHDPFAPGGVPMTPVDYDPFAEGSET